MDFGKSLGNFILLMTVLLAVAVTVVAAAIKANKKPNFNQQNVPVKVKPSMAKVVALGFLGTVVIFSLMYVFSGQILLFFLFPIWIAVLVNWKIS